MNQLRFEIVVIMTGTSRHTGQMTCARTSYLSREILWAYRYTNITHYDDELESYVTNIEKLDEIDQLDTALCSAKRLEEILLEIHEITENREKFELVNQIYRDISSSSYEDEVQGIRMAN